MKASKEFVTAALSALEHTPNRALGQNFCIDGARLSACVDALGLRGEPIIEIGPGLGGLTELLLQKSDCVRAIEKDAAMADYLRLSLTDPKLSVEQGDALRVKYEEVPQPFSVVGNLPYYITTSLCERVLLARPRVFGCMVQREAADRFFAGPKEDNYGALSVVTQLYYDGRILGTFPEESFYPAPNVQSVFVGLAEKPNAPVEPIEKVFAFVRTCLGMRRKTLKNNVKSIPNGLDALAAIGVDPSARAETLAPQQFLSFYRAVTAPAKESALNPDAVLERLTLDDLQPSQFYISEAKLSEVLRWFDPNDLKNFEPIPVKRIDGAVVMLDGHTRAVAAYGAGLKRVPLIWEPEEWDWEMYRRCVRECILRDVHTPADLIPRVIPEGEYWEKWDAWCDRMQAEVEAERKS